MLPDFFKPKPKKPEISEANHPPESKTPSQPGFFAKNFPSKPESPQQPITAINAINQAQEIPPQRTRDLWNNFTNWFRQNKKNIGFGLATFTLGGLSLLVANDFTGKTNNINTSYSPEVLEVIRSSRVKINDIDGEGWLETIRLDTTKNSVESDDEDPWDSEELDEDVVIPDNLNRIETNASFIRPEFIKSGPKLLTPAKSGYDDIQPPATPPEVDTTETSQQQSDIPERELTPEEEEFKKLEGLLDEMDNATREINTNQTIQPINKYYRAVENLNDDAFKYLQSLVGDNELELNNQLSSIFGRMEQLLKLQLTDDDKNGVEALKTMLMKELNERNFSKQEISDFFQPIINRIWKKISRYNINIPAQFQPKNSTEQNPELVNLNHELADLVEDAKISGLSSELVKTYTKLGNIGLTPELLKAQIKNLKLDIITHTLKSIEQNKPFTISIETQKLITNPDLVKTAIERNPEFLVPEFFQNFITASQKMLKNTQALEFEKQAIIFLLDFIFKTYYAFETVFMNQPVFESTEAVLNAIQSAEKEVIYTDGKNSFVISSFEIRNRIWLKMKLKNSNGFQFFKFQINEIGKVYPLKNFTFA